MLHLRRTRHSRLRPSLIVCASGFLLFLVFVAVEPVAASIDGPPTAPANQDQGNAAAPLGYYPGDPLPPKTVYLTFDDGPSPYTAEILDILKAKGVKATFFINSFDRDADPAHISSKNNLLAYKDVLKRLVTEGHSIGNHTFSHRDLARLTVRGIRYQLDTLMSHLREALGDLTPQVYLIRPPFGSPWLGSWGTTAQKAKVGTVLAHRGIVMMWTPSWDSGDSADWVKGEWYKETSRYNPARSQYAAKVTRMDRRLMKAAKDDKGGIILMHDTHPTSRDLLAKMIDDLKSKGFTFDTLDNYVRWRWGSEVVSRFQSIGTPFVVKQILPAPASSAAGSVQTTTPVGQPR